MSATILTSAQRQTPPARIVLSSEGREWGGLQADFLHISPGLTLVPGQTAHRLGVHFGRPVNADCHCDGRQYRRIQKHGDIDVVPAGLDGTWQDDASCHILRLRISQPLWHQVLLDLGRQPEQSALTPQFQLRDARIEAIAWAIKAELESPVPADRLYGESLGVALAVSLAQADKRAANSPLGSGQTLSTRQRRELLEYIHANLDGTLSLVDLAAIAGLGVSHLKTLFRNTFGAPVHQYVLRCRVDYAHGLVLTGDLPLSQIALAAGFADQSHMARCMRRLLGQTPGTLARRHSA